MARALPLPAALIIVAAFAFLPGCGGSDGPLRYEVSGTVTYNGEPVPRGYIHFVPDASQGNQGPATEAEIVDGRYETPTSKGAVGGPHRVTIHGQDGVAFDSPEGRIESGRALFSSYETSVDLPRDESVRDFEVAPVR